MSLALQRRQLLQTDSLGLRHVTVRPTASNTRLWDCPDANVLILPLAGVFSAQGSIHHTAGTPLVYTPNHAMLLPAGESCCYRFPGQLGDTSLLLHCSPQALARALPQAQRGDGFDAQHLQPQVLLTPELMVHRSLLVHALLQGVSETLEAEEEALLLLWAVLRQASRRVMDADTRRHGDPARRARSVERVKEAIASRPAHPWTLAELARLACVSDSHLAHLFRRQVGISVYGFVLRERLALALEAVVHTEQPLTEVALDTGFASHSHFSARFRRCFGVSPRWLRQQRVSKRAPQLRRIMTAQRPGSA
jgi:AraC family transcriptional regulator